jgi:triphosphoribosyl-dephospho-CoA synthase
MPKAAALERLYVQACLIELRALKPGNVHIYGEAHGMTVDQFEASARASAPPLCARGAVGRRILAGVAATRTAVGCNTNLGIVLLAAPLIAAAQTSPRNGLRRALAATLAALTVADARDAYEAIRLAEPAGLGHADTEDVGEVPTVDLRRAMTLAAGHDLIARQYASDYAEVFGIGVCRLAAARRAHHTAEWAATLAYMDFLAGFPDSHIYRKHGAVEAEAVRRDAAALTAHLDRGPNDDALVQALLAFDRRLKARGINPGSSADLTVASLLALGCEDMLERDREARGRERSAEGGPHK